MGNRGLLRVGGSLAVLLSLAGCANVEIAEEGAARSAQAVVGVDEYLYLRCGATGWGADGTTLLTSSGNGTYTLEYNVTSDYMVSGGDQCVITRTNSASGWGSANVSYGASTSAIVNAPGQWSIGAVDAQPATIKYPALGRYRASVNWTNGTVSITAVTTAPQSNHYYLRCNATGWNVGSANRLAPAANGLSLNYSVNQSWMVTGGDQCVVTRTNQLDGWGTSQATLGTAAATTLVVPAGGGATTNLIAAGQQFAVRYPGTGQYQANFNPTTGQLRISVPGPAIPETGLHGAVESLGGNRVRVTYDFSAAEQLQDFVPTDIGATAVALSNGQMVVENVAAGGGHINAVRLIKGFKIDSLRYQARLEAGDHINVYVGTMWDGAWNPQRGYGAIHRSDGRLFVANGVGTATFSSAVVPGTSYSGRIDASEQGLSWTLNGDPQTLAFPYYGGTTRTVVLGGYSSTVAFDNLVLEGTVEGMESDGTETNPSAIHGNVVNLADGRVRITYDFSDPQQKFDFIGNSAGTRRELTDGRLVVSHVNAASALKVALYKYNVRVDRLSYRAELLAGDHLNVYLNTIWDGNWAPSVGCVGIHRLDGRIIAVNGAATATTDTTPVAARTAYVGDVLLGTSGLSWSVNGGSVGLGTPCYAGTDGTLGLGSYGSDVAFDDVVIEGELE